MEKPIITKINAGNSLDNDIKQFFIESQEYSSEYYYVIITEEEKNINDNIIYSQLINIQDTWKKKKHGNFFVKVIRGFFNSTKIGDKDNDNQTYFLLHIDETLLNYVASKLNLQVLNKNKMYLESFQRQNSMEYECFKNNQIQTVLLHLIMLEFDIEHYVRENVIVEHFPLHNFKQRGSILKMFTEQVKNTILDAISISKTKRQILRPLNVISLYYGQKIGWYITFLISFAGMLLIPGVIGFLIWIYTYYSLEEKDPTSWIPLFGMIITVWSTVFLEKWKQKQNEMKVAWDLHHFEETKSVRK